MPSEHPGLAMIEPFRHNRYPFLYIIQDRAVANDVVKMLAGKRYGLETGFGDQPSRVYHINPSIPWIATEPDQRWFGSFQRDIEQYWQDVDSSCMKQPVIALNTYSTRSMETEAECLVYRNLDYRDMGMVAFDELRKGQRVTFIVNEAHIGEMQSYRRFLSGYGYNPDSLQLRSKDLPPLTFMYPSYPHEYVLDVTK